jgi:hypothetical protein
MRVWIYWLSKTIYSVLFISGLTLYFTWVTVHIYVDKLLIQYHINTNDSKFSDLTPNSEIPTSLKNQFTDASKKAVGVHQLSDGNQGLEGGKVSAKQVAPSPQGMSQQPVKAPDNALPVWNQNSSMNKESTEKSGSMVMSSEEFYKKKEQLNNADKTKIFDLMMTRLPEKEIQRISNEVEGGITIEKWKDIQNTVKKYLKPDEYQLIVEILQKY